MPWYFPGSDSLKKRACRYLLQRYLGQFLESKLGLDQLSIDLYNGTGSVTNVNLDVDALNEVAEQQGFPIAFVSGYISQISVSIPWSALLSESSFVEITGLHVTVQPKQWRNSGFMFESMFSSMSSSMQLAEECLKQKAPEEEEEAEAQPQTFEGLELFAQAIDAVLARVKVRFIDTVVRLEHVPIHGIAGVALEILIKRLDYFDVAGTETCSGEVYHESAFTVKKFFLEGLTFALGEFSSQQSTLSTSINGDAGLKAEEECIPIARLNGRHEISLKLKQNEGALGPDVEIDVLFGAGLIFMSPRQFHAFTVLVESLTKTATEPNRRAKINKPMHASDFRRIELDLQQQLQQAALGDVFHSNALNKRGWSSANVEDSDDEFQPFGVQEAGQHFEEKELYKNGPKAGTVKSPKPRTNGLLIRRTRFSLKLGSVAVILLHEDLLTSSTASGGFVAPSSFKIMKQTANKLFQSVGILNWTQGFETVIRDLNNACPKSHLKILAAPVTIQGHENVSQSCAIQDVVATMGHLDVTEVIVEKVQDKLQYETSPLLRFAVANSSTGPHCTVKLTNAEASKRLSSNLAWQVRITLAVCESELDCSIMDRITALLQSHPLFPVLTKSSSFDSGNTLEKVLEAGAATTHVQLSAPELILNLRFPIPDLRPIHELNRIPWWRRCLREDILRLQLYKPVFNAEIKPADDSQTIHLVCNSLKALYQENRFAEWVSFLRCSAPEGGTVDMSESAGNLDMPRLTLTLIHSESGPGLTIHQEIDEDSDDSMSYQFNAKPDPMTMSTGEALLKMTLSEPSPFGKKRLIHKGQHHKDDNETDELVVPGNPQELSEFREEALRHCIRHIEISLPQAEIHFPSKQFYEKIYNRLSTDLCLWEPSAPSYPNLTSPNKLQPPLPPFRPAFSVGSPLSTAGMFMMCKSGIYDSDTDSDDLDSVNTVYQSRFGTKPSSKRSEAPSKLCITLNIGKGTCTISTPVRDVIGCSSTHRGEAQVILQDATLFSVAGFQGNANLSYLYLQSQKTCLNHQGFIELDDPLVQINDLGQNTRRLDSILYPSPAEIGGDQNEPRLAVALKLHVDERYHVKTLKLAVGLRNMTLRHRMQPSLHSWLSQIMEFLDVIDHPVAGYKPPTIVTELHLHLDNCAIDYRPLYLSGRALMTLGTFSLSSNLVAQTRSSLLRFVVEDAALHLSNRVSFGPLHLWKDYVCVLELDLLELWLRTQAAQDTSETKKKPQVDLQASLHKLHVRTCADSCHLLLEFLTYLANDGDLMDDHVALSEDSSEAGVTQLPPQRAASVLEEKEKHLDKELDVETQVHDLMAEAMQDSSPARNSNDLADEEKRLRMTPNSTAKPTEVFFFPDETNLGLHKDPTEGKNTKLVFEPMEEKLETRWNDDTLADLLEAAACSEEEEEFCLLENDPGVGVRPRSGEPAVRVLSESPVRIIENHFAIPVGKSDELKSPRHFPTAVVRYTLRDMTLIWQMYGGRDFLEKGAKQTVKKEGEKRVATVTFSKSDPQRGHCEAGFVTSKKQQGGNGRLADVLMELQLTKVRFQHELYPEDTSQSSRQVLIIGDVEIRDRLAASGLNKFLSMDSFEARPRQSHANMVVVKALHIRPDPTLTAQECSLKVSVLPLRLHVDQDALAFLTQFFSDISGGKGENEEENNVSPRPASAAPIMTVASSDGTVKKSASASSFSSSSSPRRTPSENSIQEEVEILAPPIYFRSFSFGPDVPIRLDYHGKRVDLSQGSLAGLLVGLGQLHCSELRLKRLHHKHGLLGTDRLVAYAVNEWLFDIKKHQLPNLLGGIGPMHSVVQLIQGIKDLFWLPIEQYQKDGRIVRGLQKGAHAFTTSAALAAVELTSRLVETLQSAAETAYDVVSPGPSVRRHRPWSKGRGKRTRQPVPSDLRDGLAQAVNVVREGLGETAHTLIRVATEEAEQKGMTGAVGGVLRQIPSTVVKPIILATEATVSVLGGVQSHLQPDARRQAADKWKLNN